jgi:uncharacterized cupin superfamily protein
LSFPIIVPRFRPLRVPIPTRPPVFSVVAGYDSYLFGCVSSSVVVPPGVGVDGYVLRVVSASWLSASGVDVYSLGVVSESELVGAVASDVYGFGVSSDSSVGLMVDIGASVGVSDVVVGVMVPSSVVVGDGVGVSASVDASIVRGVVSVSGSDGYSVLASSGSSLLFGAGVSAYVGISDSTSVVPGVRTVSVGDGVSVSARVEASVIFGPVSVSGSDGYSMLSSSDSGIAYVAVVGGSVGISDVVEARFRVVSVSVGDGVVVSAGVSASVTRG